jgi:myo-inositol-1(or 4)-monophosphatase
MLEEWLEAPRRPPAEVAESRASLAADLAVRGGLLAMERFEAASVTWKADGSMVTDADVAVQAALEKGIGAAFPEDGILGEEALLKDAGGGDGAHWWVLDPIDGTNNFGRGLPGFSVSVGVLHRGQPVAGAVYDPLSRWLFTAAEGEGAWLNGRRLRLAPVPLSPRSLFAVRSPYEDGVPRFVERWLRRYRLRRFGSTALQLCYVAMGALTFVHEHDVSLWDVAGAAPVLLEAGGLLTGPEGRSVFPLDPRGYAGAPLTCLAANPLAHAQVLAEIGA